MRKCAKCWERILKAESMLKAVKVHKSVQKWAKVRESMLKAEKVHKSVQKYAKVC